jgi:hypothetical protein
MNDTPPEMERTYRARLLRRALFLRLYGADFSDEERLRIAERIGRDP